METYVWRMARSISSKLKFAFEADDHANIIIRLKKLAEQGVQPLGSAIQHCGKFSQDHLWKQVAKARKNLPPLQPGQFKNAIERAASRLWKDFIAFKKTARKKG